MRMQAMEVNARHGPAASCHGFKQARIRCSVVAPCATRRPVLRSAACHPKAPQGFRLSHAPHGPLLQHQPINRLSTIAAAAPAIQRSMSERTRQVLAADFDLPLAIALAAAAFEAYFEPIGVDPGLRETLVNDTHVTYTDRSFLLEHFEGLLRLTIKGAKDLKAVNITGGSDPYVIATLGDSSATTAVLWGDLNPTWDETHTLYVRNKDRDTVRLRVLDKNQLLSDVDLGVVMISVYELLQHEGQEMQLELRGTNAQGHLTVSAEFLPFSEELLTAATAEGTQIPTAGGPGDGLTAFEDQLQTALVVQETVVTEVTKAAAVAAAKGEDIKHAVEETAGQLQEKLAPVSEKLAPAAEQAAAAIRTITANLPGSGSSKKQDSKQQQQQLPPPGLGEVVREARQQAVEELSTALDQLEHQLKSTGLHDTAAAVAQSKTEVLGKVEVAADNVSNLVESEGLEELPANDLTSLILRLTARRSAQESPAAAAAAAASAAAAALPAFAPEAMPGAWKALASVAGKKIEDEFFPVAYVENVTTDTQVWVQVSREQREVVVAFRGTEQVKWKDFVSDINLIPQTLDVERTGGIDLGFGTVPLPFATFKKNKELMVHSGFLTAYDSVKVKVLRLVDQLTADATADKPWKVFITGHSLGGALATLCAYQLAGRKGPAAVGRDLIMYTFGAPRVGNRAFADAFNARMGKGKSWRITNKADIVPSIPRLMGYAHVKVGVRLDADGQLTFEEQSKDILGEGREVAEVITELASQALEVAQGQRALEDVVDAIQEHEMAILNALVDGSALGQHMEDFYLATLKEAVLAADPALAERVAAALEQAAAAAVAQSGAAADGNKGTVAAAAS